MQVRIAWEGGGTPATLNTSETAKAVYGALPLSGCAKTWGQEVYFEVPLAAELAPDAREVVAPGTICFWPQGHAIAIPYGPTPVSQGDECRLVGPVNVLGRLEGDPAMLGTVEPGTAIRLEMMPEV